MLNRPRLVTNALFGLTSCLLALASGCSTQKSDAGHDSSAPDASPDAVVTTGPIWTEQSRAIEVSCFGFFQGSKRIRATREQLTADQLAILSGLKLISPHVVCDEDTTSCSVAITAADGSVATYLTEQADSFCGTPPSQGMISFVSFSPFLQSVPCLSAKQGIGVSDGGMLLPSVTPDVRCFNGVFTSPPDTVQRLLAVDDPSIPRHVELDSCNDTHRSPALLHPQLLAPDGTTPLPVVWVAVTTDPGPDGTCFRADYTFPAAGAYVLKIDVDTGFTAGDFYLRFY
jgi:hypothetical protein